MSQAHVSNALAVGGAIADDKTTTRVLVLTARVLYSAIFVFAALGHFSSQTIAFAAAQGVPLANVAVPLSGILSLLGGLSVLLGYHAKWGALALIAFLVPVTFMMHAFWGVSDPMMKQMQMVMFMKNLGLIGGALLIYVFGAGPLSLDNRRAQAA